MATKSYPTDLTDEQKKLLEPLIPAPKGRGRPRTVDIWAVLNAIFYVLRTSCAWRMLPHDFPAWQTVYYYFRQWKKAGVFASMNDTLRVAVRTSDGRNREPSAAIVDSQSVKTTEQGGPHGYDAGKKVNGRKRHVLVDTMGLLLAVVVHTADIQDRDGAKLLLEKVKDRLPRLQLIWADGGYAGQLVTWVTDTYHWVLEIIKRPAEQKGFSVLPRRWVVERTFAWLGRYRRLSKDYEAQTETSEALIYAAMTHLMVRRLARLNTS